MPCSPGVGGPRQPAHALGEIAARQCVADEKHQEKAERQ
jgi:hypothetical protein